MSADLHVCGQIVGGSGFHAPEVSCSWRLIHDLSSWMHIAGPAQVRCNAPGMHAVSDRAWCLSLP